MYSKSYACTYNTHCCCQMYRCCRLLIEYEKRCVRCLWCCHRLLQLPHLCAAARTAARTRYYPDASENEIDRTCWSVLHRLLCYSRCSYVCCVFSPVWYSALVSATNTAKLHLVYWYEVLRLNRRRGGGGRYHPTPPSPASTLVVKTH